jgi:hypothetical protein
MTTTLKYCHAYPSTLFIPTDRKSVYFDVGKGQTNQRAVSSANLAFPVADSKTEIVQNQLVNLE